MAEGMEIAGEGSAGFVYIYLNGVAELLEEDERYRFEIKIQKKQDEEG